MNKVRPLHPYEIISSPEDREDGTPRDEKRNAEGDKKHSDFHGVPGNGGCATFAHSWYYSDNC